MRANDQARDVHADFGELRTVQKAQHVLRQHLYRVARRILVVVVGSISAPGFPRTFIANRDTCVTGAFPEQTALDSGMCSGGSAPEGEEEER